MTPRAVRFFLACLLGTALTATQALAAASTACQPKANSSCCCPKQHAAPACHMGCTDQHAPEPLAVGASHALTVPVPHAVAAAWLTDGLTDAQDASSIALARCPFHPPTLKRYLLDRTLRL